MNLMRQLCNFQRNSIPSYISSPEEDFRLCRASGNQNESLTDIEHTKATGEGA